MRENKKPRNALALNDRIVALQPVRDRFDSVLVSSSYNRDNNTDHCVGFNANGKKLAGLARGSGAWCEPTVCVRPD